MSRDPSNFSNLTILQGRKEDFAFLKALFCYPNEVEFHDKVEFLFFEEEHFAAQKASKLI